MYPHVNKVWAEQKSEQQSTPMPLNINQESTFKSIQHCTTKMYEINSVENSWFDEKWSLKIFTLFPIKILQMPSLRTYLHKINLHEILQFLLLPKITREPAASIPPYWNHEGSTPKADKHHGSHSGGKLNNRWLCFPCLAAHINLRSELILSNGN